MPQLKNFLRLCMRGSAVIFGVVAGFLGLIYIAEWFHIVVIANPNEIARYYFGSDAMVGNGGWIYRSAELYAWTAFGQSVVLVSASVFLLLACLKTSNKHYVYGLLLALVWLSLKIAYEILYIYE